MARLVTAPMRQVSRIRRLSLPELVAEITVHRRLVLFVAIHTGGHCGGHFLRQYLSLFHGTVAFGTDHARREMFLMTEKHEIGDLVQPDPFDGFFVFVHFTELHNGGAVPLHTAVAEQTPGGIRHSGARGFLRRRVAIRARGARRRVLLVAKRNRLWRGIFGGT